jgi:serine-type D-Ala-D-Ala carboxypeptidase
MNQIFKNATVPEIISGMESKFYTVFNRYNNTGNLSITLYNFNESFKNGFFYKTIYGNSEYIVPASILKLFSVNYFLSILDSNNLLEEKIQIGNEISKKYLNKYLFRIGMKKGQIYDIRELIELGLIPSSADAIYTLSRVIYNILNKKNLNDDCIKSKADWDNMVDFISNKVKEYYKSNFNINLSLLDPTGIKRDLIQVKDIGNLVNSLINDNSKILNVVAKSQTTRINGRTWNSTNAFVRKDKPHFYHPKIIGLKTGSLDGWKNLLLLYKLKPINYIAILVAGCENHSDTKEIANLLIKELDNKLFNISF